MLLNIITDKRSVKPMGEFGLPIILLAVIWGVFNPILKALEVANGRRDKIPERECECEPPGKLRQRWFMVYDDWLVLAVFCTVFIGAITLMIIVLSGFFTMFNQDFQNLSDTIFRAVGSVMLILSLVTMVAGVTHFFTLRRTGSRSAGKKSH
jgi:hypothetical protein